ncbi:putative iron-regulated membrane protein [Roseimicrobium gellanilyticum]|uniref:Putative iron-regulated membrane protein n=1 Tax=Roseimicrobium gellanilyticum TaxID=748857 RepID=A0A366HRW9_9BACT|nr:PepSY-associated TM helix domain-containing protein [Roseimicrobium gellanilyticum]RBP45999.1 putative iron-regulated membrane protein [Roseimicrobium gellanilyticum]
MLRVLRSLFFWSHLVAGVVAGLIILVMAVTGVIMTYERQILEWADGYHVTATQKASGISMEQLLGRMGERAKDGPAPSGVMILSEESSAVAVNLGREKQIYVHPESGDLLGEGNPGLRGFFKFVLGLHRWLAAQGDYKDIGGNITKAANVAFLLLMLTGVYLWWPKHWTWRAFHMRSTMNFRIHGKARHWNWHHALGFWGILPLSIIALTGLIMSYGWANNLLYSITGTEAPPPRQAPPGGGKGGGAPPKPNPEQWKGLDAAWKLAEAKVPGWESIQIKLPEKPGASAAFTISTSHRGRPDLKSTLTIDLKTGAESSYETFADYNTGRKLRLWSRWVHTGEAGGWIGQTLAGLASLAAALLVWTGLALTWKRFFKKKQA